MSANRARLERRGLDRVWLGRRRVGQSGYKK